MEFQPPFMRLLYGILHGIPHRGGSLASFSGQPCAPGFKIRFVDCIGRGAHLKYNGVAAGVSQFVELLPYICLGAFGCLVLPLRLADHMQPCSSEFPFGIAGYGA